MQQLPDLSGAGVSARHLTLTVSQKPLIEDASFAVPTGRTVALVGRNGSGKSTLLETIAAQARAGSPPQHVAVEGELRLGPGTRVAILPQNPQVTSTGSVEEYLDDCAGEVSLAWNQHEHWSARLGDGGEEALQRYGEALETMQRLGAWDYPQRRREVVSGLGLDQELLSRPLRSLSGGEATRAALAGVLLSPANLILLDEPTNNLDFASLAFLSRWVVASEAGILVVSHDRDFLDQTVGEILEVEERTNRMRHYGGSYSFYEARREEEFAAQLRAYEEQEGKRRRLETSIGQISERADRFQNTSQNDYYRHRGAKVAKQARAQATRVERELNRVSEPKPPMPPRFIVLPPAITGGTLFRATGLTFGYGEPLFSDLDLTVGAGERTAVIGANGSGKTTLISVLAGELEPERGELWRAQGLRLGRLRQVQLDLVPRETLLEHVLRLQPAPAEELRAILGKVLFRDPASMRASEVSEGELRRAECAALFASAPDLIVLDEPTNHLDLPTIDMLEQALGEFKGAVLAVSHDRRFLRRLRPQALIEFGTGSVAHRLRVDERDLEMVLAG
ncbi:MAG TPA: ABC-F family ATP-binding cassette domain-containing protein [Candidatus Dormibacteraeota bacterium]|jgi:ATPase subunit of ABC transporter with duplicated ATPase domains|nr:ABC-F family ATP-binding cassette domain-containing protein [Candidatus Dormibacteraeota bacterium]